MDPSERPSNDVGDHQRDERLPRPANTLNNGRKDAWVFRRWAAQKLLQAGFIRLALALAGMVVGVGRGRRGASLHFLFLPFSAAVMRACMCQQNPNESKLKSRHLLWSFTTLLCPEMEAAPSSRACEWLGDGMQPLLMMPSDCVSPGYEHNGLAKSLQSRRTSSPYGREQPGSNANLHSVFIK